MKVLLIPANPYRSNLFGSVLEHAKYLSEFGRVFWNIGREELIDRDITKGYFYYTPSKRFEYSFDIDWIGLNDEIERPDLFRIFVPTWREDDWDNDNGTIWILINNISQLRRR